jgi:diguanylate cyclase (GGDEF)-like protein
MHWWKNEYSMRNRLIITIALVLLAGFIATNAISFYVSKGSLQHTIIENELPLVSDNIYSEIQADLLRPIFIASQMAHDTFLKDWLLNGEKDVSSVTRYLESIRKQYHVFTSFVVAEHTHNYYHFSGLTQVVDKSDANDAWYFRVRDMQKPYEINVDYNAAQDNTLTIFINHRLLDYKGNFLGATGVGLKLDTVGRIVDSYGKKFGRNIYFIDDNGMVMLRSNGAAIHEDDIRHASGIEAIAGQILSSKRGAFKYRRNGETYLLVSRYIPELHWRVLIEERESEAMQAIRNSLMTNIGVSLAVILLTIVIIIYAVNRFQGRLASMAVTDGLTGIGNRKMFDLEMERLLLRKQRDASPFALLLVDIDHFKAINDRFGHLKGDEVLCEIAGMIWGMIREADLICRWGGDEMVIVAEGCDRENALELAEKIRAAAEAYDLGDGCRATVSIGVTDYRKGDDEEALLARVDAALYRAKEQGRDRVEAE